MLARYLSFSFFVLFAQPRSEKAPKKHRYNSKYFINCSKNWKFRTYIDRVGSRQFGEQNLFAKMCKWKFC